MRKLLAAAAAVAWIGTLAASVESDVEALLGKMTLKEKVGQLNQLVAWGNERGPAQDREKLLGRIRRGEISSFYWSCANPKERNAFQRAAVEESRLGIPLIFGMDMIHGTYLIFPNAPAIAGAFEPELFERAQAVSAKEMRAEGVDWTFAPMCDTARDPRWGRVQETCGEDPYLNALCCAAQVRGFQGTDPSAPDRVAACAKHYVAYSAVTGGRDYNESEVTEWQLRNLHLPPFRAAVEDAHVLSVMSSFNSIDGIPGCANRHTLTEVLRDEWRFRGCVISDWEAISELVNWGFAKDRRDGAVKSLLAGNDMDMKAEAFCPHLEAAVEAGEVPVAAVDEAVRRVLRLKHAVGLFKNPYVDDTRRDEVRAASRVENAALARECVRKSAVLLKNADGALPLDPAKLRKVALIGPYADDAAEMLGAWSPRGRPASVVTLAAGLKAALPAAEVVVVKGCDVNVKPLTKTLVDGTVVTDPEASRASAGLDAESAVRAAREADAVLVTLGEPRGWTGENQSRAELTATGRQMELFEAVVATGRPVIALVFAGRPLALNAVWEKAAAVLYCWQPGCEAGNGLADLLLGKASPSARLVMSIPYDVSRVPCFYNSAVTGRPQYGHYVDVVERGARYPFGFGLTYSSFAYSAAKLEGRVVSATVTNVGGREATETPQLYVRQVVCGAGWRPVRELRGFRRLTLKPGEKATVSFELTDDVLGYTTRDGRKVCDAGDYLVWIAPDSSVRGLKPVTLTLRN